MTDLVADAIRRGRQAEIVDAFADFIKKEIRVMKIMGKKISIMPIIGRLFRVNTPSSRSNEETVEDLSSIASGEVDKKMKRSIAKYGEVPLLKLGEGEAWKPLGKPNMEAMGEYRIIASEGKAWVDHSIDKNSLVDTSDLKEGAKVLYPAAWLRELMEGNTSSEQSGNTSLQEFLEGLPKLKENALPNLTVSLSSEGENDDYAYATYTTLEKPRDNSAVGDTEYHGNLNRGSLRGTVRGLSTDDNNAKKLDGLAKGEHRRGRGTKKSAHKSLFTIAFEPDESQGSRLSEDVPKTKLFLMHPVVEESVEEFVEESQAEKREFTELLRGSKFTLHGRITGLIYLTKVAGRARMDSWKSRLPRSSKPFSTSPTPTTPRTS